MAQVSSYRRYTRESQGAEEADCDTASASASRQEASTRSVDASSVRGSKRRRASSALEDEPEPAAQCTPAPSSSSLADVFAAVPPAAPASSTAASSRRPPVPSSPATLAELPFDILERIGELLLPVIVPALPHGVRTTSKDWIDPGIDLIRFSSTCKTAWAAARPLVGRVYGTDARASREGRWRNTGSFALEEAQLRMFIRLLSIKPPRDIADNQPQDPLVCPANKIRHLYLAWSTPGAGSEAGVLAHKLEHMTRLADRLEHMTRLESLALVVHDETTVTAKSPYSVATLPADILVALSKHRTIRELYLCGIRFSRRFVSGAMLDDVPAMPKQLRALTLNACHDSALELVTLAPGATSIRVHRDFASPPRVMPDCWWDRNVWTRVEELEMVGFSGVQGVPLFNQWRTELLTLRNLTPSPFIPLRTLRLYEPFSVADIQENLLPALAHLPQLKHFTIHVWYSREFGPALLGNVHGAMPDLEELGIALDSEALAWWSGALSTYASQLALFRNLRTFTWNYCPYADLDAPSMRSYTLPIVSRTLLPLLPSLTTLRWFGQEIFLRPLGTGRGTAGAGEWVWSDDERVRPVTQAWMRRALAPPLAGADVVDGSDVSAEERWAVSGASGDGTSSSAEEMPDDAGPATAAGAEDDNDNDEDEIASSSPPKAAAVAIVASEQRGRKRQPRRSMLEQLVAARAQEAAEAAAEAAAAKGKGKGKERANGEGAASLDGDAGGLPAGFW